MHRMRAVRRAVAMCMVMAAGPVMSLTTPGPVSAAPRVSLVPLETPSGVAVTPVVGGVVVSWLPEPDTHVHLTVTSTPPGLTCTVVDRTSCTLSDRVSTPYSFSVAAQRHGLAPPPPSAPTVPLAPNLVLVVAGQSNATGIESFAVDPVTGVDYLAPPYTDGADAADLLTWEPWQVLPAPATTPVPLDAPQVSTADGAPAVFGPEIGLARQLWADTGRTATIVKAACPGSLLAQDWLPTGTSVDPCTGLFASTVDTVTGVMAADAAAGTFDVLGAVYWYQGESDASVPDDARHYRGNLRTLIRDLRSSLPLAPTAPVVLAKEDISADIAYEQGIGAISAAAAAGLTTGNEEVRAADDWVAADVPGVVEVDTSGLPRVGPDDLHLSDVGELTLGQELAVASEPLLP